MRPWIKLFAALAASAAFASIAAALASANGTKTGGATVAVAKSPLGRILVDSTPDVGTRVRVVLPLGQDIVAPTMEPKEAA